MTLLFSPYYKKKKKEILMWIHAYGIVSCLCPESKPELKQSNESPRNKAANKTRRLVDEDSATEDSSSAADSEDTSEESEVGQGSRSSGSCVRRKIGKATGALLGVSIGLCVLFLFISS